MEKIQFDSWEDVEREALNLKWYLDSGLCPADHKPEIRRVLGELMDALARRSA